MARNLTDNKNTKGSVGKLARIQNQRFKVSIEDSLENKYCFKNLTPQGIKNFHKFVEETVGKGLSISKVDELFLRNKKNIKESMTVNGVEREVYHYGKDKKAFRVFGHYNKGYFVLTRIDPNHKTHR